MPLPELKGEKQRKVHYLLLYLLELYLPTDCGLIFVKCYYFTPQV